MNVGNLGLAGGLLAAVALAVLAFVTGGLILPVIAILALAAFAFYVVHTLRAAGHSRAGAGPGPSPSEAGPGHPLTNDDIGNVFVGTGSAEDPLS